MELIFLLFQLLFAFFFVYLCLAFVTGAPFVPSTPKTASSMIALSGCKAGENLIDLGSGEGRLVRLAAAKGAHAVGVEINPYLVWWSRIVSSFFRYPGTVRFIRGNFWSTNVTHADVVCVYLLPWKMERLEQKLRTECKHGARIVSNSFVFPNLPCIAKDETLHVYVFQIPKNGV